MINYADSWRVWYYPDADQSWWLVDGQLYGEVVGPPFVVVKQGIQSAREYVGRTGRGVQAGVNVSRANRWDSIPLGSAGWAYMAPDSPSSGEAEWIRYQITSDRYGLSKTLTLWGYTTTGLVPLGRYPI